MRRRCFNSILVRLKDGIGVLPQLLRWTFQFHTGSIKSDTKGGVTVEGVCFNSILVRLKVVDDPDSMYYGLSGFNSILVRLKVGHRAGEIH